jgi:pyridoxal phosphate enzyme (YggS family)
VSIAENIARVRERMDAAAHRAGRDVSSIQLMGVTKTKPPTDISEAIAAGLMLFGENYVQEFQEKRNEISGSARFHLIGHLQSNKANRAAELFDAVDSLDSLHLAEKLNAAAARLNEELDVLLEVNLGGEDSKSGLREDSQELEQILSASLPQLRIRGLMTIPPFHEDSRPYFRRLKKLAERLQMKELSMGMSHDFEMAIEEGSTCVRVGTAIFGARAKK